MRTAPSIEDPSHTGMRLSAALLGYFGLVTIVITLSPFDFAPPPRVHLSMLTVPSDMLANVALFVPLGFLLRSLSGVRGGRRWLPLAQAAGLSLLIETAQIFLRDRYVSPVDVATNSLGAYLGIVIRDRLERWAHWRPGLVGHVGLDIPLAGLLYLLVPQLWLSSVGMVEDLWRSTTTLLLGCAGSIVFVALNRHRWAGGARLAANAVPPVAVLWFMAGALPALAVSPATFGAMAAALVTLTCVLLRGVGTGDERRFEADTLQRFMPVFATYVVVSALWPPLRPLAPWHGALGFLDRLNDAGVVDLLLLLEQVGAFTLLGYAAAEWRGRQELSVRMDLPRVAVLAAAFALALELVQGMLAGPGASLTRAALATIGAVYGAALYHLARSHVRALRAARQAGEPAATRAA